MLCTIYIYQSLNVYRHFARCNIFERSIVYKYCIHKYLVLEIRLFTVDREPGRHDDTAKFIPGQKQNHQDTKPRLAHQLGSTRSSGMHFL